VALPDAIVGFQLFDPGRIAFDGHDRDNLLLPDIAGPVDHTLALFDPHPDVRLVGQQHLRIEYPRKRDIEKLWLAIRKPDRRLPEIVTPRCP
jgi:hypothetical protein